MGLDGYLSSVRRLAGEPPVSDVEMQFDAEALVAILPASLSDGHTSHRDWTMEALVAISGLRQCPGSAVD